MKYGPFKGFYALKKQQGRREIMKKGVVLAVGMITGLFFILGGLPTAKAADVVKIGVLGPMTGGVAIVGNDILRGIKVGAKEINDRGGVKVGGKMYKIEIVDMDDGAVVANAVANARRMVAQHKVSVIMGPPISSCVLAILEFNEKKETRFLNILMAMHPDIVNRGNKLVVRTAPTTKRLSEQTATTLMKLKKPKTVAIIYHMDDWGTTWKDGVEGIIKTNGGKVSAVEGIDERKQTDFYVQLTKIVGTKPDAIVMIAHDAPTAMMVRQVREIGYKGRLVFSEGFQTPGRKLVADKLENCMWPANTMDFNTPNAQRYKGLFLKLFPHEAPQGYGSISYDQIHIVSMAMEKAQTMQDPYAIRAAIPEVMLQNKPNFVNLFEACQENGQATFDYITAEQKGGKLVLPEQE
jgi:branched-chain amino acid transport system substrate-binding protein